MLNLVKYEGRYDDKTKGKEKTVGQNSVKLYFLTGWLDPCQTETECCERGTSLLQGASFDFLL